MRKLPLKLMLSLTALILAVGWGSIAIERYQAGVEHANLIEQTIEQQLEDAGLTP